jgi:hypothetical protein
MSTSNNTHVRIDRQAVGSLMAAGDCLLGEISEKAIPHTLHFGAETTPPTQSIPPKKNTRPEWFRAGEYK